MSAVTEIKVVVARIIPRSVRKLRSLLLLSESIEIRPASQKEALRRSFAVPGTGSYYADVSCATFVPLVKRSCSNQSSTTPSSQKRGLLRDRKPRCPPCSGASNLKAGLL